MPLKTPPSLENTTPHITPIETYLEGPWCDVWSFGMVVTRLVLGRDTDEDKRNVSVPTNSLLATICASSEFVWLCMTLYQTKYWVHCICATVTIPH